MKFDIKKNKAVVILLSVAALLITFLCVSIFTRTTNDDGQNIALLDDNSVEADSGIVEGTQEVDDSTASADIQQKPISADVQSEQQTMGEGADVEQEPMTTPEQNTSDDAQQTEVPKKPESTPAPVTTPEPEKTPEPVKTPEPTEEPAPTPEPEPEVITVTISIDAKTAVNAGCSVNKWVLGNTEVEIEAGSTVWDVLNKVARESGIPVSKIGSGKMLYVQGIGGLFEFDCGDGSGWMYNVNGTYPLVSCGAKEIKNGDDINWRYTCELGNDLGAPMH